MKMDSRCMMEKQLSAAQFAVWEIHLFLDTHPNDEDALSAYNQYLKRYEELHKTYTEKFGALSAQNTTVGNTWQWVDAPWPWDSAKEGKQ